MDADGGAKSGPRGMENEGEETKNEDCDLSDEVGAVFDAFRAAFYKPSDTPDEPGGMIEAPAERLDESGGTLYGSDEAVDEADDTSDGIFRQALKIHPVPIGSRPHATWTERSRARISDLSEFSPSPASIRPCPPGSCGR